MRPAGLLAGPVRSLWLAPSAWAWQSEKAHSSAPCVQLACVPASLRSAGLARRAPCAAGPPRRRPGQGGAGSVHVGGRSRGIHILGVWGQAGDRTGRAEPPARPGRRGGQPRPWLSSTAGVASSRPRRSRTAGAGACLCAEEYTRGATIERRPSGALTPQAVAQGVVAGQWLHPPNPAADDRRRVAARMESSSAAHAVDLSLRRPPRVSLHGSRPRLTRS